MGNSTKRTVTLTLAALAAATLFAALVHAVLSAAHLSQPAATTVHGLTLRRLWATGSVVVALVEGDLRSGRYQATDLVPA